MVVKTTSPLIGEQTLFGHLIVNKIPQIFLRVIPNHLLFTVKLRHFSVTDSSQPYAIVEHALPDEAFHDVSRHDLRDRTESRAERVDSDFAPREWSCAQISLSLPSLRNALT